MKGKNSEKIELLSSEAQPTPAAQSEDGSEQDGEGRGLPEHRRLGVPVTVFMIIGKVLGAGLVWFPKAVSQSGWMGFVFMGFFYGTSTLTGVLLARSWLVLVRWFPDKYRDAINRHPYPSIGYETYGTTGRRVTAVIIGLYAFGFTVALYLVAASNVQLFFSLLDVHFPLCLWILVVICLSAPLLWLGTPKDMVGVGIALASTTIFGVLALLVGTLLDIGVYPEVPPTPHTFVSVSGALGLIMSAFGGQFVIPTLQHDMKRPEDMQVSAAQGYTAIASLYLVIGVPTYLIYGDIYQVYGADNVIALLTTKPIQIVIVMLLSTHLIAGCVFINNPLFQDLESRFNIPYDITWKRVVLRSSYSALVLLVAVSVPDFPTFMAVVGGLLAAVVNGVLPNVLYMKLCSLDPPPGGEPEGPLRWYHLLVLWTVILVSVAAALLSSVSGVYSVIETVGNATLPCYVNIV